MPESMGMAITMRIEDLEALKERVAAGFNESPGGDLDAMGQDIAAAMRRSGLFTPVMVGKTGGHIHLVEARCGLVEQSTPAARIAAELQRIWLHELRYDDFEAHALLIAPHAVYLDFLTVAREARMYVTGIIKVERRGEGRGTRGEE
jgi:hypothetical protein